MQATKRTASALDRGEAPVPKKVKAASPAGVAAVGTPVEGSEKRGRPTYEEVSPATMAAFKFFLSNQDLVVIAVHIGSAMHADCDVHGNCFMTFCVAHATNSGHRYSLECSFGLSSGSAGTIDRLLVMMLLVNSHFTSCEHPQLPRI